MRNYLLLIFLALTSMAYSQQFTLKGKVTDPDNLPLEAATVYLNSTKDSTLISYTITDKNGNWQLKTRANANGVFLKIAFMGFATHSQKVDKVDGDHDFGTIKLADKGTDLNEVVIEGEVPPIRVKKDTLEFDAASFRVREDATVQELLKQLPGVEIDEEGKITVNGKEVSQILVNGKPFFDKDGKIALQNLPADIINKIQVSDLKTKEEELTGQKAKGNESSINITIDEEKNKGIFGRLQGGVGSDGRYEHSGMVNYFKGNRKISILASTNNINSTGFSMNEIFDNMSGGRNVSAWSDGKSFNINGMQFGGGTGITRSDIVGVNYADTWTKGFDGALNYFYTGSDSRNNSSVNSTNFVPRSSEDAEDISYSTRSESSNKQNRYGHYYNTQFEIKPDSTVNIYIEPKFVKAHSESVTTTAQESRRLSTGELMNENAGTYSNGSDNLSFNNMLVVSKKFKKKGRFISLDATNSNEKGDNYTLNNTITNTYDYSTGTPVITTDNRNQLRKTATTKDNYMASVSYGEPVSDSSNVYAQVEASRAVETENRRGFNYNDISNGYNDLDDALSGYLSGKTQIAKPTIGFNTNREKMYLNLEAGANILGYEANGSYLGDNLTAKRNMVLPAVEAQITYNFTKTKHLWASYNYQFAAPAASQILAVANVINPLATFVGNMDLDFRKYHTAYLSYYNYDWSTNTGYSFYGGGNYYDSSITTSTNIDANAISTTTYDNVSGTYNLWFGADWAKTFKNEAHSFNISIGGYASNMYDKGFLNSEMYTSNRWSLEPEMRFTYKYGEVLTINPYYSFEYSKSNYSNYTVGSAETFMHRAGLSTTSYWPKHIVFGNDITFYYNPQQASFRKDYYLWNTSIGYNFWKDRLTFKVKVYDLLNQNQGVTRSVNPTGVVEEMNTVLKRYAMFSLSVKLDKFGGKKDEKAAEATGGIIMF